MLSRTPGFVALVVVCVAVLLPAKVEGAIRLGWDPSPDPAVVGYSVWYGAQPSVYTARMDVGPATQADLPPLPPGTYYVAVQAYTGVGVTSPFSNEVSVTIGAPLGPPTPERKRADFDTDGQSDILWQNTSTGQIGLWALIGTAVKSETTLTPTGLPDLNWRIAGTGDFNGDGRADIVWHHGISGAVAAWFMNGTTFLGVQAFSVPQIADVQWKVAGVGDFNRDGNTDILWQHDTGPLRLWTLNGMTVTEDTTLFPVLTEEPMWRVVGVTDINLDGHVDVLWRHSDGWLAAWMMDGTAITSVPFIDPMVEWDQSWRIVGSIDANQDGKPDIVWQHMTQGTVRVWLMNGVTRLQSSTITQGSFGGPSWKVVGPK